jgi:UDP-2,4-diacetamido-2,4,6-trideoxy-beta-L-altropyranose hydrolase
MKNKVYIRVEANQRVGLGHFFRCLALAEMIDSHFYVVFVGFEIAENILKEKKAAFFKIGTEQEFFYELEAGDIVVVDGYDFQANYYKSLKRKKVKVVSIQDIQRFSENIDLVINHLPGAENEYKHVDVLGGPKHAIIRKKLLEVPEKVKEEPNNILISLGGTENYSLVNRLISMLNATYLNPKIKVLTTDANGEKITGNNVVVYSNLNEDEIIQLIDCASICVITSGMISYEVLARNRQAVVGALNAGQDKVGRFFGKMKLVEYIDFWKDVDISVFSEALKGSNIDRDKVKLIFDGKSGERIKNKFLEL